MMVMDTTAVTRSTLISLMMMMMMIVVGGGYAMDMGMLNIYVM
jgi:hypothetical protein